MANDDLKDLSTHDLLKKRDSAKLVTGVMAVILLTMFVLDIVGVFKQPMLEVVIVLVALGMLPVTYKNYKKVRTIGEELRNRGARGKI